MRVRYPKAINLWYLSKLLSKNCLTDVWNYNKYGKICLMKENIKI